VAPDTERRNELGDHGYYAGNRHRDLWSYLGQLHASDISGSRRLRLRWSAVGEFSEEYAGSGPYSGGVNNHQNNLLLGADVVYRWSRNK
jgi:hypothetical protein